MRIFQFHEPALYNFRRSVFTCAADCLCRRADGIDQQLHNFLNASMVIGIAGFKIIDIQVFPEILFVRSPFFHRILSHPILFTLHAADIHGYAEAVLLQYNKRLKYPLRWDSLSASLAKTSEPQTTEEHELVEEDGYIVDTLKAVVYSSYSTQIEYWPFSPDL